MRPTTFTHEEDRILLQTAGMTAGETNARLEAAGHRHRPAEQLKRRRFYLRTKGVTAPDVSDLPPGDLDLVEALRRRAALTHAIFELGEERMRLEKELGEVHSHIKSLLEIVGLRDGQSSPK